MKSHIASLGLLLPLAACLAAPSESTASSSSAVTAYGADSCIRPAPQEPSPGDGHGPHEGGCEPPPQFVVTMNQAQGVGAWLDVSAGVDWPTPASVSVLVVGLPAGVTWTWNPLQAYNGSTTPPQDIEGFISFSASAAAPPGTWYGAVVLEDGNVSYSVKLELIINACTPYACAANQCNAPSNGCGGLLDCGECPLGAHCSSSDTCVDNSTSSCPAGTHSCGGGICAKVCE